MNEAKERLAWEVTALIHGAAEADRALSGAKAAFGGGGSREAMPQARLALAALRAGYNVVELFYDAKLCDTKSEARRLVEQGGAFVTEGGTLAAQGLAAAFGEDALDGEGALIIRAGKKRYCRLTFE